VLDPKVSLAGGKVMHCYEVMPTMAMHDDPLTGTKAGDCIPGHIKVASDHLPHAALLRVPVVQHRRVRCHDVYELWQLVEEVVNGRRVDCAYERQLAAERAREAMPLFAEQLQ
jgi:hypothetical protein